ncbi:hypothetical protein LXA43DRAFT_149942 [Ganoderma leucocontextum]|nr:hypothetical protein LXA43DRAFT_149942 [Ganoderma leucocontextum]
MLNVSLVVEPEKFLELFVPEPTPPAGKTARRKPANPFFNMEKPTTERKMYEDYPKNLNSIVRGSGYAFVATPYKADKATDPKLAVDCGMYPRERMPKKDQTKGMDPATKKDFRRVCWSGLDLPAECKLEDDPFEDSVDTGRPHSDKRRDASGQALSYVELVYHHQHRAFVFMLIFVGVHCRLVRVDRSGLFVTKRFNITETEFLVEFLWRYTQLSPEDRGYDTTAEYINPLSQGRKSLAKMMKKRLLEVETAWKGKDGDEEVLDEDGERVEKHVVKLWKDSLDDKWPWWKLCVPDEVTGQDRWFLTGKPSFQAPGVRGRGTRCYIAIELFIRDGDVLELDTKFVYLKDCWRVFVDGAPDQTTDIRKEGDTLKKLNDAQIEHVPTLVAHGDIKGQRTSAPQAWKKVNDKHKCRLKTHQHYRLVVKEIGMPLSEFENSGQLVLALYDCLRAHRDAMDIRIIHRDISGGNILLYKNKKGRWRGLLTDWELSKDTSIYPNPRQVGRTGTLQFSAARVLDQPWKTITAADEIECVFHVLIYYAVRFLQHNLPDKFVGLFLKNYFDASSGMTQTGELTAPVLKREAMKTGAITLETYGVKGRLRFIWVDEEPQGGGQDAEAAARAVTPPLDYDHPLNELIDTLLSWFSALYAIDLLDNTTDASPGSGSPSSRARRGRGKPALPDDSDSDAESLPIPQRAARPSREQVDKLRALAAKLEGHSHVVSLFHDFCRQSFPSDKGEDKRPEKGYTPCSPETPQFSELSGFTDFGAESDDRLEYAGVAAPDAPAPNAFAELGPDADGEQDERRAPATVASDAREDELEYDDGPRTPSPCPSRAKRGREDDAAPGTFGKRSRY